MYPYQITPAGVRSAAASRVGSISHSPFEAWDLGSCVGESSKAVPMNRARVNARLALACELSGFKQVHRTPVCDAGQAALETEASIAVAFVPGLVCAAFTAHCLFMPLCGRENTCRPAAQTGRRVRATGMPKVVIELQGVSHEQVLAWLSLPKVGERKWYPGRPDEYGDRSTMPVCNRAIAEPPLADQIFDSSG